MVLSIHPFILLSTLLVVVNSHTINGDSLVQMTRSVFFSMAISIPCTAYNGVECRLGNKER